MSITYRQGPHFLDTCFWIFSSLAADEDVDVFDAGASVEEFFQQDLAHEAGGSGYEDRFAGVPLQDGTFVFDFCYHGGLERTALG